MTSVKSKATGTREPNLFIVGAAKAGTTSLWYHLKSHPDVFMPEDELHKEPGFFSPIYCAITEEQYLSLFSSATDERYVGEASTVYLTDPQSAKEIYRFCPEAKIIMTLRNPVDRAYSLFNWMAAEGYEYASSFPEALVLEDKRKTKTIPNFWEPEYFYSYMYFSSGLYSEQVRRYLQQFPRENVLILRFDDLKSSFRRTFDEVCRFLDIATVDINDTIANQSQSVIHPRIQFVLRKLQMRLDRRRRHSETKSNRDSWLRLGMRNRKPRPMSDELRQDLASQYSDDISRLSELTGIDFSSWNSAAANHS